MHATHKVPCFIFFKLIYFLLDYSYFTMLLVSSAQQSELAICLHISPLFLDILPI